MRGERKAAAQCRGENAKGWRGRGPEEEEDSMGKKLEFYWKREE